MQTSNPVFANLTLWNSFLVLFTFAAAWALIRYLSRLLAKLAESYPRARFFVKMVEPVLRIMVWFSAAIASVGILAPSQDAFFAGIGSAALAIGLGAQDLIKNIIGGLVIIAVRPFQVGDRVKIGEAYGEITQIGMQTTSLVTPGDTKVTIPNATALNSMSWNANSGVPDCQVQTDVLLPITSDSIEAIAIGKQVAITSPYTYLAKPVFINIGDRISDSPYQALQIKAYVYDHRYEPAMMSDITRRTKLELVRRGMLQAWGSTNVEADSTGPGS